MAKIDDASIKELKAKCEDIYLITDDDGDEYVCRPPTTAEVERSLQQAVRGGSKLEAVRGLVHTCTLWPDQETLSRLLEKYPLLAVTLDSKISDTGKLHQKAKVKKL